MQYTFNPNKDSRDAFFYVELIHKDETIILPSYVGFCKKDLQLRVILKILIEMFCEDECNESFSFFEYLSFISF